MKQDEISRADSAYARYMANRSALFRQRIIAAIDGDSSWQLVLQASCAEYHVLPADVLHGGRSYPIQKARATCMKRLRAKGYTLEQIGKWMNRGHDTVSRTVSGRRRKGGEV